MAIWRLNLYINDTQKHSASQNVNRVLQLLETLTSMHANAASFLLVEGGLGWIRVSPILKPIWGGLFDKTSISNIY